MMFFPATLLLSLLHFSSAQRRCRYGFDEVFKDGQYECVPDTSYMSMPVVVGCVGPNFAFIPKGEETVLFDKNYKCQILPNGWDVDLVMSMYEYAKCGDKEYGDEWIDDNSFKFNCSSFGVTNFISCITPSGVEIPKGEERLDNRAIIKCHQRIDGKIEMESTQDPWSYKCLSSDGKEKIQGEEWLDDEMFPAKCSKFGYKYYIGCDVSQYFSDYLSFNRLYKSVTERYLCDQRDDTVTLRVFDRSLPVQLPTDS